MAPLDSAFSLELSKMQSAQEAGKKKGKKDKLMGFAVLWWERHKKWRGAQKEKKKKKGLKRLTG